MTKIFLILILSGFCQAQTNDVANRRIHHEVGNGRTKHTIGDLNNSGKFQARCKWEFFFGEDTLELVLPGVEGDMMIDANGVVSVPWRQVDRIEFIQDGALLRWCIELNSKPPFNSYTFNVIGWENYNWDLQTPFPNPEEYVDANDGQIWLKQGPIPGDPVLEHRRLKSIDGGYVVWHKTKQGNKYRTGDVLSIHRPKMTDSSGDVEWATLTFDSGQLTVSWPSRVWAQADYPVVINDTFGEDGDPSAWSLGAGLTDYVIGDWATPTSSGTGVSMHTYCKKGSGSPHLASQGVYDDGFPTVLVTNAETPASANIGAAAAWVQTDFGTGPSFTGSTQYQVAFHMGGAVTWYYTTTGASGRGWHNGAQAPSDGSMPTGFTGSTYTRRIAIYCTYTPNGGVDVGQVIIISN